MEFGSVISPAKVLEEATFHDEYKNSKNTGNVAISTAATSLEARKKKKKGNNYTCFVEICNSKLFKYRDF